MKSIDDLTEVVQQCTQCDSQGEIMIDEQRIKTIFDQERENYKYRNKLTIDHVKTLEKQIEILIKDKQCFKINWINILIKKWSNDD